jgi:hypothetical protein
MRRQPARLERDRAGDARPEPAARGGDEPRRERGLLGPLPATAAHPAIDRRLADIRALRDLGQAEDRALSTAWSLAGSIAQRENKAYYQQI